MPMGTSTSLQLLHAPTSAAEHVDVHCSGMGRRVFLGLNCADKHRQADLKGDEGQKACMQFVLLSMSCDATVDRCRNEGGTAKCNSERMALRAQSIVFPP